jgi:hypothetical protein
MSYTKILLIAGLFSAYAQGASAQNYVTDAGTAETPAQVGAAVTYTSPGTGATPRTVASKLAEWVSVTDFGADPTGVADSTTPVANAYARVVAMGGGTLFFPPGTFSMSSMPTIAQNGVTVQCSGASINGGTRLSKSTTTGDFLVVTGAHDWIRDCYFAPSVIVTSGYQIKLYGAYHPGISNVRIDYSHNGVYIISSSETHIKDISLRYMFGTAGIFIEGTVSSGTYATTISDYIADNPYPISYGASYSTFKTWTTSTAYSVGDVIHNNSSIYVCTTAGTSSNAGTGPSGKPAGATTPASVFSTDIVDGSAHWEFVSAEMNWLVAANYSYSLRVNNSSLLEGYVGLLTNDVANTGSSYPKFIEINDLETDHNYSNSVLLNSGLNVAVVNGWFGSSLTASGVNIASGFKGMFSMANSRVMGNAQYGVLLGGGVQNLISNNWISTNSIAGSGSFHGIGIAANLTRFIISNNYLGKDADAGSNLQGYGILLNSGTSDYYNIVNNVCGAENVSGCAFDGGSGTNKTVTGNH